MKLKKQINFNKYSRMQLHPEALIATTFYKDKNDFFKIKEAKQSFLVGDWLYAKVETKTEDTYVKYFVADGEPRKDSVAFHVIGKLWVF
jgi:hypothetical protein